jgi:hypothetical protein
MTDETPQKFTVANMLAMAKGRFTFVIGLIVLGGLAVEGLSIWSNYSQGVIQHEIALNAAKRQLAEQQEKTALAEKEAEAAKRARAEAEIALITLQNAAKLKKGEADKMQADAETAAAIAKNSLERQRAETEKVKAEARLAEAKAAQQEVIAEAFTGGQKAGKKPWPMNKTPLTGERGTDYYNLQLEAADNLLRPNSFDDGSQKKAVPKVSAGGDVSSTSYNHTPTLGDKTDTAVVTSLELNVRNDGTPEADIVGKLKQNQSVRVFRRLDSGWVEVQGACDIGNCRGFVNAKYLAFGQTDKPQ